MTSGFADDDLRSGSTENAPGRDRQTSTTSSANLSQHGRDHALHSGIEERALALSVLFPRFFPPHATCDLRAGCRPTAPSSGAADTIAHHLGDKNPVDDLAANSKGCGTDEHDRERSHGLSAAADERDEGTQLDQEAVRALQGKIYLVFSFFLPFSRTTPKMADSANI